MFHEAPDVIHTELPFNTEGLIEEGHVFTVEPVVCMGTDETITWDDGWTVATADGLRSAQFEHTVAMTAGGPVRLTGDQGTDHVLRWRVIQIFTHPSDRTHCIQNAFRRRPSSGGSLKKEAKKQSQETRRQFKE